MATEPIRIATADIRTAIERLLGGLGDEVEFNLDFYWDVGVWEAFDLNTKPELGVGQVSDDVESIRSYLAGDSDNDPRWHTASHLVGVLRAIAASDLPSGRGVRD